MVAEKQTGLSPKWPRGRAISETFGFFAKVTLFVQVVSFFLDHLFPKLDPGDPSLVKLAIGVGIALLLGSVWMALTRNLLGVAQIAIAFNAALLAGVILSVIVRNFRTGDTIGVFEGLLLYGLGSAVLAGYMFAFREIGAERQRRAHPEA